MSTTPPTIAGNEQPPFMQRMLQSHEALTRSIGPLYRLWRDLPHGPAREETKAILLQLVRESGLMEWLKQDTGQAVETGDGLLSQVDVPPLHRRWWDEPLSLIRKHLSQGPYDAL